MVYKLQECITELHKNHTGEEVAEALSEYFQAVWVVAAECTDEAAVWDLKRYFPAFGFMNDDVLEEILKHARALRHKGDSRESAKLESGSDELEKRLAKMEELHRKQMEEARRRERTMLTYMGMIAANRQDETAALLSALDDKAMEAKYKDYRDS